MLLCDFEDDLEFYRHPEGKAGNSDYQPSRHFFKTKHIPEKIRDCIRYLGLVEDVPYVAINTPSRTTRVTRSIEPRYLLDAVATEWCRRSWKLSAEVRKPAFCTVHFGILATYH